MNGEWNYRTLPGQYWCTHIHRKVYIGVDRSFFLHHSNYLFEDCFSRCLTGSSVWNSCVCAKSCEQVCSCLIKCASFFCAYSSSIYCYTCSYVLLRGEGFLSCVLLWPTFETYLKLLSYATTLPACLNGPN